ncbi:small ribosomal subunit Rsm22 family protein [Methanofollis aquaemaris]|nr:class I SAM-dependent methyltransferase [Methanofollis aquaemaris]
MTRPSDPLLLSPEGARKQEVFFSAPRVPRRLERLIEEYIGRKTGKAWDDRVVLERIRAAVVAQKGQYWARGRRREISYEKGYNVFAYLAYHTPVYLVQTELLLHRLVTEGLLPRHLRVLDVGCGPGVVSAAVVDYFGRLEGATAEVTGLDRSEENLEAYAAIVRPYAGHKGVVSVRDPVMADLCNPPEDVLTGSFDLIVFSNVLNELRGLGSEEKADLVAGYARFLSPEGSILLAEPAEKETSTGLREVQRALVGSGMTVYAPCTYLWGAPCQPERCWTFESGPEIRPPRLMEALVAGKEGYRFRNTDIKVSYAVLRADGLTRWGDLERPAKSAHLGALSSHVGRQVNLCAARMSGEIGDEKRHVVKICDGTTKKPVYAVLPEYAMNEENASLLTAEYGDLLFFANVKVKYNKEVDTYSVIVGKKTTVTPLGRGNDP